MNACVAAPADTAVTRFLLPGEWAVAGPGDVIATLLGSCVAMLLWEPRMRLGSLCHFVLPRNIAGADHPADGRFADVAFNSMRRELSRRGVALERCILRIYGGARTYETGPGDVVDIGQRNIDRARDLAGEAGLAITEAHTGGLGWWRLRVDFATGEVLCRFNPRIPGARPIEEASL